MTTSKITPGSWSPPDCPNRNCIRHNDPGETWRHKRIGTFRRHSDQRRIQRFLCNACKRSFSTQTFSTTYWQKLPDIDSQLITKVAHRITPGSTHRDKRNNLWVINLLDLLIRHNNKNHTRETRAIERNRTHDLRLAY